ncbi:porphobilinogen deaminase-like [Ylistrum balloti]|uniref:porphobilinogen deaminase-like n=1 Tax=Ylistrum balloti TaxID=509963 RepID=UPI0029057DFB|nr:porphobilinogen deaminase-like [Ylistrum balloti]
MIKRIWRGKKIRVATRKSPLALAQTKMIIREFKKILPMLDWEIVFVLSHGDMDMGRPLHGFSQVGVFVKALENALLKGEADCAIHCLKDIPSPIDPRFILPCCFKRETVEDVILYRKGFDFKKIQKVSTGSLRRRAFLGETFPQWTFEELRGNINTRISKLVNKEAESIVLAQAGISRLKCFEIEEVEVNQKKDNLLFKENLDKVIVQTLPTSTLLPAPGQGCLVIQCLKIQQEENVSSLPALLNRLHHEETWEAVGLERKVMEIIEGGCRSPLGCFARKVDQEWIVEAILERDGMITRSKRQLAKEQLSERKDQLIQQVTQDLLGGA